MKNLSKFGLFSFAILPFEAYASDMSFLGILLLGFAAIPFIFFGIFTVGLVLKFLEKWKNKTGKVIVCVLSLVPAYILSYYIVIWWIGAF